MKRFTKFCIRLISMLPVLFISGYWTGSNILAQTTFAPFVVEDFEQGKTAGWSIKGKHGLKTDSRGNHFVQILGPSRMDYTVPEIRDNYIMKCKCLIREGGVQFFYRLNQEGFYSLLFHENLAVLTKNDRDKDPLILGRTSLDLGSETWHSVELEGDKGNLSVRVDDQVIMEANDLKFWPKGRPAVRVLPNSMVWLDELTLGTRSPVYALINSWLPTGGPSGGMGYDIRIHPENHDIMFVTDNPSGVNKSVDGGETWAQKNSGISTWSGPSGEGIPIFCLTIDPNNPDIIWCGTQYALGIYKSTDCGENWTKMVGGIKESGDSITFRGFAVYPGNSDIVLAAAQIQRAQCWGKQFEKSYGVIYKTTDGGNVWEKVYTDSSLFRVLIFDPVNPRTVYCSSGIFDAEALNSDTASGNQGGVGVIRSDDGGDTWKRRNLNLDNLHVGFLEMDPSNSSVLYAAAHCGPYAETYPGYCYKTKNKALSWTKLSTDDPHDIIPGDRFSVITVSPSDPDRVYAASQGCFYRSDDAGDTWSRLYRIEDEQEIWGPPGVLCGIPISIVVHPHNPDKVFVNNYSGGTFISGNGGLDWKNSSKGYSGADIRAIVMNPENVDQVYATGRSGTFKTDNAGGDWSGLAKGNGVFINQALALFPGSSQLVLGSGDTEFRMCKSDDGGASWRVVFPAPESDIDIYSHDYFSCIAVAPSDPAIVYAGVRKFKIVGWYEPDEAPSLGVFKSVDYGETWTNISERMPGRKIVNAIAVHPENPEIVYAGTYYDGIFKKSADNNDWTPVNDGLGSTDIRSLAIHPVDHEIVFAGAGNGTGIFRSVDGGGNWLDSNEGIRLECPSYLLPAGKTFIGVRVENIRFLTSPYPTLWTSIQDIEFDPVDPLTLYAADLEAGVFISKDGGRSWSLFNQGFRIRSCTALTLSPDGSRMYAATSGAGVYKMQVKKDPGEVTLPFDTQKHLLNGT